jgi:hypothetical protein
MPRVAKAALGSYTTPFGTAHFTIETEPKTNSRGLRARGSSQVLRWLFPKKNIKDTSRRS